MCSHTALPPACAFTYGIRQSKEALTTNAENFGSKFVLRAPDVRKIVVKTGLVARVVRAAEGKMGRDLDKSTAAVTRRSIAGQLRLLLVRFDRGSRERGPQ